MNEQTLCLLEYDKNIEHLEAEAGCALGQALAREIAAYNRRRSDSRAPS